MTSGRDTNYPHCADHSAHDVDCNACYLRREHAENQERPAASGHVVYHIANCPDCAATRTNGIVDCAQCGQSVDRVATATVAWASVCRPCLKSALDSIGRVEWAAFETALQDLTAARSSSPERQRFDAAFGTR